MTNSYTNTVLGAILSTLGLAIIGLYILPDTPTGKTVFGALVLLVLNQLLGLRQADANGHRLSAVEDTAKRNVTAIAEGSTRQDAIDQATGIPTAEPPPLEDESAPGPEG